VAVFKALCGVCRKHTPRERLGVGDWLRLLTSVPKSAWPGVRNLVTVVRPVVHALLLAAACRQGLGRRRAADGGVVLCCIFAFAFACRRI